MITEDQFGEAFWGYDVLVSELLSRGFREEAIVAGRKDDQSVTVGFRSLAVGEALLDVSLYVLEDEGTIPHLVDWLILKGRWPW